MRGISQRIRLSSVLFGCSCESEFALTIDATFAMNVRVCESDDMERRGAIKR